MLDGRLRPGPDPVPAGRRRSSTVLVTLMIPPAVTFIPSFIIVSQLRWVRHAAGDHRAGAVQRLHDVPVPAVLPNFPRSLEEAARVDGLGYFGAYWRVVVPNSGAFFAAMAVITFIASWNAFLWPLVIGQDSSMWTVQVALSHVPDRADHQPARAVPRRRRLDRAARPGVRLPAALPGAGCGRDRHQGLTESSRKASSVGR